MGIRRRICSIRRRIWCILGSSDDLDVSSAFVLEVVL
jgi:hypothetical protein